jgi:hypothetical protein
MIHPKDIINLIADNVRQNQKPVRRSQIRHQYLVEKNKTSPKRGRAPVYRADVPIRSLHRNLDILPGPL